MKAHFPNCLIIMTAALQSLNNGKAPASTSLTGAEIQVKLE